MISPKQALLDAFLEDAGPHVQALRRLGWDIAVRVDTEDDTIAVHLIYQQPRMLVPVEAGGEHA